MTYEETVSALSALEREGIRYDGPERAQALLGRLGSPESGMTVVHVAGTNGKGSVCAMLSEILTAAGRRVGTFFSPAVFDRRECYCIDGVPAPKEALARAFSEALALREDASAFETEFCAAMALFRSFHCEYAVVECGMGGRRDATNALQNKRLAVLTSVSADHTAYLGETLAAIAREKAAIAAHCPLVTGSQPPEVTAVLEAYRPIVAAEYGGAIGMQGAFQRSNAGIAAAAARELGIGEGAIAAGIRTAYLPGRFERISRSNGTLVLDGAHNPGAARRLREALCAAFPGEALHFILGMFRDKAADEVLSILLPLAADVLIVQAPPPRGMPREELARLARRYCDSVRLGGGEEIARTLRGAGTVVACGSFSILSEVRRWNNG